jgi:single-strand DNA-binding protein
MASLNSVALIGHLGADPESRAMPSGDQVATLSLATTEKWKDKKTGQKQERTEWHRVVFFGRIAEVCSQYLQKGDMIHVTGRLRTNKWTDKQQIERYSTEIVGAEMIMLVTKGRGEGRIDPAGKSAPAGNQPTQNAGPDDFGDDIPFIWAFALPIAGILFALISSSSVVA